jgi:SEFIR domain
MPQEFKPPKLFMSYSWTSEDHKQWVLNLATGLRENGVDVILDRWHLLDGQDTHLFMERMVNDPEIKHVALICDRKYVEKANSRDGGVGVEAQIITPSIYVSHQQTKFVAVVTELDENGKPYVPTYYGAKKWLPFLDAAAYADDFDTLLRWVFDKPLDKPPPLGKPPAFLTEEECTIKFATTSLQRRAVDAIKSGKSNALANLTEYLDRVVEEFEKLRVRYNADDKTLVDDRMVHSIEAFLPCRNELIATFVTVATYANEQASWETLHRFFERLIPFQDPPAGVSSRNPAEFDNYTFIISELFLYLIASNLKYEKFDSVEYFLGSRYFVGNSMRESQERMQDFQVFWSHSKTLEARQQRLGQKSCLQSVLLKERSSGQPVSFDHLMTADFILYVRSRMDDGNRWPWFPFTSLYISRYQPMELFARAQSARYFTKIRPLLGAKDVETLKAKVAEFDQDRHYHPRVTCGHVMDIGKIASIP